MHGAFSKVYHKQDHKPKLSRFQNIEIVQSMLSNITESNLKLILRYLEKPLTFVNWAIHSHIIYMLVKKSQEKLKTVSNWMVMNNKTSKLCSW